MKPNKAVKKKSSKAQFDSPHGSPIDPFLKPFTIFPATCLEALQ